MRAWLTFIVAAPILAIPVAGIADLSKGIAHFEEHQWLQASNEFIETLSHDPSNAQAHEYLAMTTRQMQLERNADQREQRLELLGAAARRLERNNQDGTVLELALRTSADTESQMKEERWTHGCVMARAEMRQRRWPVANDLALKILTENPSYGEAQRILSDLQVALHQELSAPSSLTLIEQANLEGFYAYGRADYLAAVAAWDRTLALLEKSTKPAELAQAVASLRFRPYKDIALVHVAEEREQQQERALFSEGLTAFDRKAYSDSLGFFRKLALLNPAFPQLGFYLVQSEVAVEKARTSGLSDEKRQEAKEIFAKGMDNLARKSYREAKECFQRVLAMDPSHPKARTYMSQIDTEVHRKTDPVAAQQHYEAGLIAYAGGDLEQATREWHIAQHLDPDNSKIANAANKVQRELVLSHEGP